MNYKCPLCLKILDGDDYLVRFCSKCATKSAGITNSTKNFYSVVRADSDSIINAMKCIDETCSANRSIENGVYFSHLECSAMSPYYQEVRSIISRKVGVHNETGKSVNVETEGDEPPKGEVSPPEKIGGNNVTFRGDKVFIDDEFERREFVQWQIGMLNKVPDQVQYQREIEKDRTREIEIKTDLVKGMWFPLMLLRATAETTSEDTGEKRIGTSIALIGERKIGKTILAFQALDRNSYLEANSKDKLKIFDYLHYSDNEAFYSALELRFLMRRDAETIFRFDGTPVNSKNIHSVFFEPQNHRTSSNGQFVKHSVLTSKSQGIFSGILSKFKTTFLPSQTLEHDSFYYSISFYDLAGEDVEAMTDQIKETSQKVDKIGILINANSLINVNKTEDLGIAIDALRSEISIEYCIIFTHLDELLQKLGEDSGEEILPPKKNSELRQCFIDGEQKLQKEFLNKIIGKYPSALKNELMGFIEERPVFFIGHENLPNRTRNQPKPNEQELNEIKQPFSIGLIPFVCWCLDLQWEAICKIDSGNQ